MATAPTTPSTTTTTKENTVTENNQQNPAVNRGPEADEATKKRQAYANAEKALRERHQDEFRTLVKAEAQKLGVEYNFRPTAEERAAQEMRALLAKFPALREQVAGDVG